MRFSERLILACFATAILMASGCSASKNPAAGLSTAQQQAQEQISIAAVRSRTPVVTTSKLDGEIATVQSNSDIPADMKARMIAQIQYAKRFANGAPVAGPGPNLPPAAQPSVH